MHCRGEIKSKETLECVNILYCICHNTSVCHVAGIPEEDFFNRLDQCRIIMVPRVVVSKLPLLEDVLESGNQGLLGDMLITGSRLPGGLRYTEGS